MSKRQSAWFPDVFGDIKFTEQACLHSGRQTILKDQPCFTKDPMTFRTSVPRAIERKGHQAANLMAALTDPLEASMQSPRTDKPVAVIETARFPKGNSPDCRIDQSHPIRQNVL